MKQDENNELWSSISTIFYNKLPLEIINNIYQQMIFKPSNKKELQDAVNVWCKNKKKALQKYEHIKYWNTSLINDMSGLFFLQENFNDDISTWNTSNLINACGMFRQASSFNCDISNWDMRRVEITDGMFAGASSFNQDLIKWELPNVISAKGMFERVKIPILILKKMLRKFFDLIKFKKWRRRKRKHEQKHR